MRYLAIISYDGSKYYGFQRQKSLKSVQGEMEEYLSKLLDEEILIKGAGRTDRGVHAKGQCFHFETNKDINTKQIKRELNSFLKYIKVKKILKVNDDFHSRFSVRKKHYSYHISFNKNDYDSEYVYFQKKIDIKKMKEASKLFLGIHNFQNFVSGTRDNYECIIYKIRFVRIFNKLTIHFYGKSFYRYMVRNMVGALIDIGKGKCDKSYITKLLNSPKTDKMLSTAPAKGLVLEKIYY